MLVRVVAREDGGVTVIRPVRQRRVLLIPRIEHERVRGIGGRLLKLTRPMTMYDEVVESDAEYYADVFDRAISNDPSLADRPYTDLEDSELPPRASRDRWRLRDGRVVVGD